MDWTSRKVIISNAGIKKHLEYISPINAIMEYIWNGFDAKATKIEVNIKYDATGKFNKLEITDNGEGIAFEELDKKFDNFYETQKTRANSTTLPKGRKGIGRLTFSKFCYRAKWDTVYKKGDNKFRYIISMDEIKTLNVYEVQSKPDKINTPTGTKVIFDGFKEEFSQKEGTAQKIIESIKEEFCWFLELFKEKGFLIKINGEELDYKDLILDTEIKTNKKIKNSIFNIKYIQWKKPLKENEASKLYFLDENNEEIHKENTPLFKEDDVFHHSVFISSAYFKKFNFHISENSSQTGLEGKTRKDEVFQNLSEFLTGYLRKKRKPFLSEEGEKLAEAYDKEGLIFIKNKDEELKEIRKKEIKETIKEFYKVEPKIFTKLNPEQKKTFLGFLSLVLDSEERDRIIEILQSVVDLTTEEREELRKILKLTPLRNIINTINFIAKRKKELELLEGLVLGKASLTAKEVEHLQEFIEKNIWIFGEEYLLYGGCETNFYDILKTIREDIFPTEDGLKLVHKESRREVDLFAYRQQTYLDNQQNMVLVELKKPSKMLSYNEITQIKKYRDVINSNPTFKDSRFFWKIILIGTNYDDAVKNEREREKGKGEIGLIEYLGNSKLYIKSWAEIINDFKFRYNELLKRLDIDKKRLIDTNKLDSGNKILNELEVVQNETKLNTT